VEPAALSDAALTMKDGLLLLQAALVIGGGFFFAGKLGAKLDHLSTAIESLKTAIGDHSGELRSLEHRTTKLEQSMKVCESERKDD